jgi:hypothetical protein
MRGTQAYDFEQKLDKAKSLAGTIGIEAMRGLGAMSEKEFEAAKASIAKLELGMATESIEAELDGIIRLFENKLGAVAPAAGSPAPAAGSTAPAATPADAAAKANADRAAKTDRLKAMQQNP